MGLGSRARGGAPVRMRARECPCARECPRARHAHARVQRAHGATGTGSRSRIGATRPSACPVRPAKTAVLFAYRRHLGQAIAIAPDGEAGSEVAAQPNRSVCECFLKSPYAVSPPLRRVTQARTGTVGHAALGVGLRWYSAPTLCSGSRLHLPARGDTVMASPRRRGSPAGSKFGPGSQAEPPRASAFCQSNSVYVLPPRWEDYGYGPMGQ